MYTVIILNKHSSDLLQDYRFLFKPFVDDGIIGFCDWNESGTDIRSSVPDLYNIVKGKKEWRALVVNTDSVYKYKDSYIPAKYNPFDYSKCDTQELPHESPIPLVRLTHIIGGYNATPTKEFEKGFEYVDIDGNVHRVREADLTEEQMYELASQYEDLVSIYMEKETPADVKRLQKELSEKYQFADIRPTEIQLVATRRKAVDDEKARIEESWKNRLEMTSSAFWEKNKYPNNCRFLFKEVTNSDNSLYQKEMTEFWLAVLTLAINKVAASTLQAYRLYRLDIDISKDSLDKVLNDHLNKMYSAYGFVKEQLRLRPEYSFDENEEVVTPQNIPVSIDKNEGRELYVDFGNVGLCRDCPGEEMSFWNEQMTEKKENFEKFLKAPRRAIDKSATFLKHKTDGFQGEYYELDEFQVEDLQEKMEKLEQQIIGADTKSVIDKKKIQEQMDTINKEVKKEISFRLRKKMTVLGGLIALAICFAGFIPYIILSGKLEGKNLLASLLLTVIVLAISSIGGIVALLIQRKKLVAIMKQFNTLMRNAVNSVHAGAEKFEKYFSDICTYMKAQSIFDGIRKHKQNSMSRTSLFNAHKKALNTAIDRDLEWLLAYGIDREDEMIPNVTVFFKPEIIPRNNALYYFERGNEEVEIPINSTGDLVYAPYKFIEKLWVERENIFDEVAEEEY